VNSETQYINRNLGAELLSSNLALFSQALRSAYKPKDCIEFWGKCRHESESTENPLSSTGSNLPLRSMLTPQMNLRTFLPPEKCLSMLL